MKNCLLFEYIFFEFTNFFFIYKIINIFLIFLKFIYNLSPQITFEQ